MKRLAARDRVCVRSSPPMAFAVRRRSGPDPNAPILPAGHVFSKGLPKTSAFRPKTYRTARIAIAPDVRRAFEKRAPEGHTGRSGKCPEKATRRHVGERDCTRRTINFDVRTPESSNDRNSSRVIHVVPSCAYQ